MNQGIHHKVLFKSTFLDLLFMENRFLQANWKGYVSVEKVKMGCENILSAMDKTSCYFLVNDNRKVQGTWTQSIKWLETDFMPRMVEHGLKKIAYLYSPDLSARYSLDRLLEVNDQYEAQTFDCFEKATLWLLGEAVLEIKEPRYLQLKNQNHYIKVLLDDIYYISTHDGQSIVQTKTAQYFTRKSLSKLMEELSPTSFYRIHKSHIVNIQKIDNLKYYAGGSYHLFLKDFGNVYLTVSKNRIKALKEKLFVVHN